MIAVDTNILVYAHREELPQHARARARLVELAEGAARWAIPVFCLGEFLRVVTHPRLFDPPFAVSEACQALGAMLGTVVNGLNPETVVVTGGVAGSLVPLEKRIVTRAGEYAFPRALAATRIAFVPGDKAVTMRGAAALVFYETARERTDEGPATGGGRDESDHVPRGG